MIWSLNSLDPSLLRLESNFSNLRLRETLLVQCTYCMDLSVDWSPDTPNLQVGIGPARSSPYIYSAMDNVVLGVSNLYEPFSVSRLQYESTFVSYGSNPHKIKRM